MAKIAVIGSGMAGLASAWILSQKHDVTLYEKNDYIGGHTNTRTATFGTETVLADTGFMVFNHRTYPNMVKMFEYLGVETIMTDMAFGVSANGGEFEFTSDNIFVQKKNMLRPAYWRMILDIIRFNRTVEAAAAAHDDEFTLKELLNEMRLGEKFQKHYLLPMSGEIWSTDKNNILEYPAKKFVTFFNNHGLLSPKSLNPKKVKEGRLQWYTVKYGAQEYVKKIRAVLNAEVLMATGVVKITREAGQVLIEDEKGVTRAYDHVVCAGHPDQTLAVLAEPTEQEKEVLGAFVYNKNMMYMHKDTSGMLKQTKHWPSWTYSESANGEVEISYYMNRLQMIDEDKPVIVTLNPTKEIAKSDIFYELMYEHPRFTVNTALAQEKIIPLQGTMNTWFAGAWLGYGFHEDALRSALAVGKGFDVQAPWE